MMRKSGKSPVKLRQRVSTRSTRAAVGPFCAQPYSSRIDTSSPSATISIGAVGAVLHPARDAEPPRFALGRCAEVHTLYAPAHQQLELLQSHGLSEAFANLTADRKPFLVSVRARPSSAEVHSAEPPSRGAALQSPIRSRDPWHDRASVALENQACFVVRSRCDRHSGIEARAPTGARALGARARSRRCATRSGSRRPCVRSASRSARPSTSTTCSSSSWAS